MPTTGRSTSSRTGDRGLDLDGSIAHRADGTILAEDAGRYAESRPIMESPEFTGRVVAALDRLPDQRSRTGRVLVGAELGQLGGGELGVRGSHGAQPVSRRSFLGGPPTFSDAVVR